MERHHDPATAVAIACVALVVTSMTHEAVGHGGVALLSGARHLMLSTASLGSDVAARTIPAAGVLAQLLLAAIALGASRKWPEPARATRLYFLWCVASFSLLYACGYLLLSAVVDFGDWAGVIRGLPGAPLMRVVLGLVGMAGYILGVRTAIARLARFEAPRGALTALPLLAIVITSAIAGAVNPLGIRYFFITLLPCSALLPLLWIGRVTPAATPAAARPVRVQRSLAWLVGGVVIVGAWLTVVAPGLRIDLP